MTELERLGLAAKQRGVHVVTEKTAKKYGLTQLDWLRLLEAQGWACAVCRRSKGVTMNTDHEHVKGWAKLPPEQKRRFVRGVLCTHCNYRVVHSNLTASEAARIATYLRLYEERRDA